MCAARYSAASSSRRNRSWLMPGAGSPDRYCGANCSSHRRDIWNNQVLFSDRQGWRGARQCFTEAGGQPNQGAIPMLKVDSVSDWIAKFGAMGGKVVIPQVVCPCTQTYFAVVTDSQGNQMLLKEPKDHKISSLIRCYWWAERISAQPFLTTITVGALGGYRSRQSCPHRSS
jgi:predicted enzyme related to lactoylglutathione lyase